MKKQASKALALFMSLLMLLGVVPMMTFTASAASSDVYFYVPEALYITPTDNGGNQAVKYFLNSYRSESTQSWASAYESTGKLYFYCPAASSVSISVSGGTVSGLTTSGTNKIDDTSFSMTAPNASGNIVTWTATYVVNGQTRTATSYSYVYKPNRVPTGVASETESDKHGSRRKHDYHGVVSVIWGANTYDTGSTNGKQEAKGPASMIYLGNNGMKSGSNSRPHNVGYFDDSHPKTFRYHDHNNINVTVESPAANFFVDVSRFTNMNQIPYMAFGLAVTDDQHTDGYELTTTLQNRDSGADLSTLHSRTEYSTEVVVYNENNQKRPSYNISGISLTSWTHYRLYTYGRTWCGGTVTHTYQYVNMDFLGCNKSSLRSLYLNAIKAGRQASNYVSGTWNTYQNALKNAAAVLGNPTARTNDVNSVYNTLNNAINGLTTYVYVNGTRNGGTGTWTDTVVIGGGTTVSYNPSAHTPTKANYTFVGWNTNADATTGSKTSVTVGFNQTIYAIYSSTLSGTFHYLTSDGKYTSKVISNTIYNNTTQGTIYAPVNIGSTVTFDGRTFTLRGWRADQTAAAPTKTENGYTHYSASPSATYYAIYDSKVTLTYNGNGGTVAVPSESKSQYVNASGTTPNRTSPQFTISSLDPKREGSDRLLGWATTQKRAEIEQVDYVCGQSYYFSTDTTIYAAHYLHRQIVRFHNDGVNSPVIKTETVRYGKSATAPENPLKASDDELEYYFDKWDKAFNVVKSDMDVYAVYEEVAHDWEKTTVKHETCTEDGLEHWICKNIYKLTGDFCAYERDVVIPAKGHTWVTAPGKDATCTEKGYTVDIRCGDCGFVDKESVEIPAKGHDFIFVKNVPNSCVAEGYDLYECSREGCTATEKRNIVAPDSTKHTVKVVAEVPATCVANGTTEYTICSLCKAIINPPKTITTQGHDWDITPAVAATCTKAGSTEGKVCKICGTVGAEVKTVPALGHNYVTVSAKEPTCTEKGNTPGSYCTRCGDGNVRFVDALGHDFKDLTITKEATCSEEGLKVGGCSRCGEGHVEEVIPKLPHTPVTIPAVEATCSKAGYTEGTKCDVCGEIIKAPEKVRMLDHTWEVETEYVAPTCTTEGKTVSYKCAVCGETKGGNTINKLNHSYSEWVTTKPASCGVTGEKVRRCVNCNEIETGIIKALNHEFVVVDGVEATCTEDGTTVGSKCKNCGMWEVEPVVIPAPGHSFGEEITVEATCMAEGKIYKVCAVCGEEEIVKVLEKTAHNEVVIPAVEPTCTRVGKTEGKKCSVCGEITVAPENIEPADHTPVAYGSNVDATCTSYGSKAGLVCSGCGKIIVKAKEVVPIEHTYSDWGTVKAVSCAEVGIKSQVCTGCGDIRVKYIAPIGHAYGDWNVITEPTCEGEGTKRCICRRCNDVVEQPIPATGHFGEIVAEVPATCENDGIAAGVKCSVCGKALSGFETLEKLGHDYIKSHIDGDCETDECDIFVCKNDPSHMYRENVVPAPGHKGGTATCTEKAVCEVCNKSYGELAPHNYEKTVVAPTCNKGGYTTFTCTECGDSYVGDNTAATGEHEFTDGIVVKAPTCTEAGSKTITCKSCGISVSVEVPAKGHTVNEWTVNGNEASGTCTECGETVTRPATNDDIKACERCGYHHTRSTGLFKYKGVFCSITYFFRQIMKFFKGGK